MAYSKYIFEFDKDTRWFLLRGKLLNEEDRKFLKLVLDGKQLSEIAKAIPCSERTAKRKKKALYYKTLKYM